MRPRLCSFELAWTDAAFDAIYPERGTRSSAPQSHLPHGIASMHPTRFFDGVLASIPFEQSLGLRFTLWMIALAPLFTIRRLGTIASITPGDRTRVLERLVTSRTYVVRQLAMSFKALATLLYVQSDAVRAAMSTPLRSEATGGLIRATQLVAHGAHLRRARVAGTGAHEEGRAHEHAAE